MLNLTDVRDHVRKACKACGAPQLADQIEITWNARFRVRLGDARWDPRAKQGYIRLSVPLWPKASEAEQIETAVHEACHVVAAYLHGPRVGHGAGWRDLMRRCGYPDANRCHGVDREGIAAARRRRRRPAACACGAVDSVGPVQAGRIRRGAVYCCHRCNGMVKLRASG